MQNSNKRRIVGMTISVALVIAIFLTGTFAIVMPMQHRLNQFEGGGIRYDATLNEDFDNVTNWTTRDPAVNKQINVTNTGNNDTEWGGVFVRINLREFMEVYETTYHYWEANAAGQIIGDVTADEMVARATLFMTDSNNLAGNASRVFVVAPSTFNTATQTYTHLTEAAARAQILQNYAHLFPNGIDNHVLVQTRDYVSGVTGWFVVSREGDRHGQFGRYMVSRVEADTDNSTIIGTPTIPRDTTDNFGTHGTSGRCSYDVHRWNGATLTGAPTQAVGGTLPAPTSNYRDWVRWNLGANVILYSEWDGLPVSAWIIDDRAEGTQGWVYWGRELAVGQTTANFLESVQLVNQPDGDFFYEIHTHMYAVSYQNLDTWTDAPDRMIPALRLPTVVDVRNPAGTVLLPNAPIDWSNPGPSVDLGNGFEVICRDEDGFFNDAVVVFGSYRQTYTGTEELMRNAQLPSEDFAVEALTWLLLDIDRETGSALLITEYVHDSVRFNLTQEAGNAYETSNLRSWLNSEGGENRVGDTAGFLNQAFTAAERARILPTSTTAVQDSSVPFTIISSNPAEFVENWSPTNSVAPAVPTNVPAVVNNDLVFVLSASETWQLFGSGQMGQQPDMAWTPSMATNAAAPNTDYGWSQGSYRSLNRPWRAGHGSWWTRSAGTLPQGATIVATPGTFNAYITVNSTSRSARPAINVSIDLGNED